MCSLGVSIAAGHSVRKSSRDVQEKERSQRKSFVRAAEDKVSHELSLEDEGVDVRRRELS